MELRVLRGKEIRVASPDTLTVFLTKLPRATDVHVNGEASKRRDREIERGERASMSVERRGRAA